MYETISDIEKCDKNIGEIVSVLPTTKQLILKVYRKIIIMFWLFKRINSIYITLET